VPCQTIASLQEFGWRISVADITQSGAFSIFPEIDRSIVLLDGGGVALSSTAAGWQQRLDTPLRPFSFRGEDDCHATLLDGPSRDFNAMTRRGRFRHQVEIRHTALAAASRIGLLLIVGGVWQDEHGQRWQTDEGCLWRDGPACDRLMPITANAVALHVTITEERV